MLGHYIRYYTDCPVIANNFLLTPQHFRKMDEVGALFSLSAATLVAGGAADQVRAGPSARHQARRR